MASIRFYLKDKKNGTAHIMAAFQNGPVCPTKYIGYTIPTTKANKEYKYWNKNTGTVRSMDIDKMAEINKKIKDWKNAFDSYISHCNIENITPDITEFIKSLSGTYQTDRKLFKEKDLSLVFIFAKFLAAIKATHDNTTIRGYKVIKGKLEKMQEKRKKEILVSHIDRSFYKELTLFLIQEEKNTNATIARRMTKIVTVLSYAIEYLKIKNVNPDYKKVYKLKTTPAAKFPLRPEELATLHAYITDNEYHRMVLDAFLLACETGLRHSDIIQLQPTHIQSHITTSGVIRSIALTNMKTDHQNSMPLSNTAAAIIDRYINCEADFNRKTLFRFQHSQAAGKVLKTIFKKDTVNLNRPCEIIQMQGAKTIREMKPLHDVISFHMARNTYITRLLSSNVAPAFVQANAGHSDIATTMSYFRNDDVLRWQETLKILNN